jgi:hypothetical protein
MGLGTRKTVIEQDWNQISTVQNERLGQTAFMEDGREFRYGLAGAADLAAGKLAQNPALTANHQNIAVATAAAVGDSKIQVTLGATATTADQYRDGYLIGYDASGTGQTLRIKGNPVIALSGTGYLRLSDPVITAITTSGKVSLAKHPYGGAIIWASGATTGVAVGVPNVTITAANYGWFQVQGIAAVLTNGTPAAGSGVIGSATTDGAVDIEAAASVTHRLGQVYGVSGVSTKYNFIDLNIRV